MDNFKLKKDFDKYSVKELEKIISYLSEKYHNEEPEVEDSVYDALVDILKIKNPNSKIFSQIGAPVRVDIEKAKLPFHLGGIVTKKHQKEIDLWKSKHKPDYMISSKLDGISGLVILEPYDEEKEYGYISIFTRGDGEYGQDVSYLADYLDFYSMFTSKNILKNKTEITIRGEFVMKKEVFEKEYSKKYTKNRTLISSVFNSKKPNLEILKHIDFVAHEKIDTPYKSFEQQFKDLEKLGINVVQHHLVKDFTFDSLEKDLISMRKKSIYEMDGIVISQNKISQRYTSGDPKYTFAFKIDQGYKAIVKDVIWNPNRNGILVPKVEIQPIEIQGDTITFSTGFNAKYIVDNNIGKGTEIIITKSGDVIPYIMSITKSTKAKMPAENIEYRWTESGVNIELVNRNIEEVKKKKLLHFFKTLEISFISEGMINKFYQNGYNTIKKIYNMTVEDMLEMEGIKDKSANKLYESLHNVLDQEIDLAKLMHASMSFQVGLGEKRFNLVISQYGKKFDKVDQEDLLSLEGFSKIISNFYLEGIKKFVKFLKENNFLQYYIQTNDEKNDIQYAVFSGFRNKQLEEDLLKKGIKIVNTLSKKVNYLIVKDKDKETSKTKKAKELNIKILQLDYFIK